MELRQAQKILTSIIIYLFTSQCWGHAAVQTCRSLFSPSDSTPEVSHITVTSLAYSPVVETRNGQFIYQPDKVLLQGYQVKSKTSYFQKMIPFFDPVTLIRMPFIHFLHQQGLKGIYQVYEKILTPELHDAIKSIEESLARNRQMLVIIKEGDFLLDLAEPNKVLGFFRVFDGTIYHNGPRAESNHKAPLELILASQGKSTKALDQMRAKDFSVFEVGKYFLNSNLSAEMTVATKWEIRKWLFDTLSEYSETDLKNTFYFAHVVSDVNQRRYHMDYGFEPVSRELSLGLDPQENILMVNGLDLYHKLKSQIER